MTTEEFSQFFEDWCACISDDEAWERSSALMHERFEAAGVDSPAKCREWLLACFHADPAARASQPLMMTREEINQLIRTMV